MAERKKRRPERKTKHKSRPGDFWKNNIAELSRRQPKLAKLLTEENAGFDVSDFSFRTTRTGHWISGLTDVPFFESGSSVWEDSCPDGTPKAIAYFMGCGVPESFAGALQTLPKKTCSVVVIEPNLRLLLFLFHRMLIFSGSPNRITFAVMDKREILEEAVLKAFEGCGFYVSGNFRLVSHKGEMDSGDSRSRMAGIFSAFRSLVQYHAVLIGNSAEDSLLGLRQMALTSAWALTCPRLCDLRDSYRGRPAVVVSAGPSLDRNLHLLKGMEERVLIVAVDSILPKMLKEGIVPHIVCSLERGKVTYETNFSRLCDENADELKEILLVVQSVCFPQTIGRWPGPKLIVGKEALPLDRELIGGVFGCDLVHSGLSVAHMCAGVADYLGASAIALIGQDLAYGSGGITHSRDSSLGQMGPEAKIEEAGRMTVPGIDGTDVVTTRLWRSFIDVFEELVPKLDAPLFDCTEGGALIRGTTIWPLARFLERKVSRRVENVPPVRTVIGGESAPELEGVKAGLSRLVAMYERSLDLLREVEEAASPLLQDDIGAEEVESAMRRRNCLMDGLFSDNGSLAYLCQAGSSRMMLDTYRHLNLDDAGVRAEYHGLFLEHVEELRTAAGFVLYWLKYMVALANVLDGGHGLEVPSMDAGEAQAEIGRIFSGSADISSDVVADNLLAGYDPDLRGWPWEVVLQTVRHYYDQGRFREARDLMDVLVPSLEGREIALTDIARIFKDWARVLTSRDLTDVSCCDRAAAALENAAEFSHGDPEIAEIRDLIRERVERERNIVSEFVGVLNGGAQKK